MLFSKLSMLILPFLLAGCLSNYDYGSKDVVSHSAVTTNSTDLLLSKNKSASASSIHPVGYPDVFGPAKAFDGDLSPDGTRWVSADVPSTSAPITLEVDLGDKYALTRIIINSGKWGAYPMQNFEIQSKVNSADDYVRIPGANFTTNTAIAKEFILTSSKQARYVRLLCKKETGPDNLCMIRELQVYGNVIPKNVVPVANAGADKAITLPTSSVTLSGSGSDPDGKISSYTWTRVSGSGTIASPNSASTSITGLTAGTSVFRLTVKDNSGASASDDVSVVVKAAVNKAPVAKAGADKSITLPTSSVTLAGSGTDSDGTIASYKWTKVSGSGTIATPNKASTSITGLTAGTSVFRLTVKDNSGASATDDVSVVVHAAANAAPVANAGADKTITLPTSSVTLAGSGSDSDGSIASYAWTKVSGSGTIASPNSASTSITGLTQGTSVFRLTVKDNAGATASDDVSVVVKPKVNTPPVAKAGNDISIVLPTNSVTLKGTASDADSDSMTYAWSKVSGGAATIASPKALTTSVTGLVQGSYVFKLTVTDSKGGASSDDVSVSVTSGTCSNNKIYITKYTSDNGKYINGDNFAYKPGDTLVLKASDNPWSYFSIANLHGTPECPVKIVNEGGQVVMSNGMAFDSCTDIIVNGSGASGVQYGFFIENNATSDGVGFDIFARSKNIEVHHTKINKKTYGFWVKQEADCNPDLQYPNWTIDNIKIHDNYITNVGQSGMYLGSTSPNGERAITCDGKTIYPIPLRLGNVKVYNNYVDHTNRSGIQLSGADSGSNEIYNNIVTNSGYENNFTQGYGIIFGGYTTGKIHHNTISYTFNVGLTSFGAGDVYIENNKIEYSGYLGSQVIGGMANILLDTRKTDPVKKARVYVRNNALGVNTDYGIRVYNSYNSWNTGNVICNTSGTKSVDAAFTYSTSCSGTTTETGADWTPDDLPDSNHAPTANAGADKTITLPTNSVTMSASAADADGDALTYAWSKVSGGAATFSSTTALNPSISGLVQGSYTFKLTVKDSKGASANDNVVVTVNAAPSNAAPVVNAGADKTITLPTNSVSLTATATDANGDSMTYAWSKVSGGAATIASPTALKTSITGLVAGSYVFRFTAKDSKGASSSDDVKITVKAATNVAPVASAGADKSITLPTSSVSLTATATDANGDAMTYAWSKVSGGAATIASPAALTTSVTGLVAGSYVFRFTATDSKGAASSDDVAVTVNPAANPSAPVVAVGPDMTLYTPIQNYAYTASIPTPNGTITARGWKQMSGPVTVSIGPNPNSDWVIFSNFTKTGTYVFRYSATNDKGATGYKDMKLTVVDYPNTSAQTNGLQIPVPANFRRFNENGPMGYYEYLPPGYFQNPNKTYPVILFLHGAGEQGNGNADQLPIILNAGLPKSIKNGKATGSEEFIILSPQSYAPTADKITSFMTYAKKYYRINQGQMYLTGLSYGAMYIWQYINDVGASNQFAAMVTISGSGNELKDGCQAKTIPIWAFHGENDSNAPTNPQFEKDAVARVNACNPNTKAVITMFPNTDHNAWDKTYESTGMGTENPSYEPFDEKIYDWMLEHSK